jgi:Flp pilus assembly protein protease CpaA
MEPNFAVAAIWAVTLCAAALSDLRSFRIANAFPAILILLFVVIHSVSGFSGALWANLLHFLLALVVGMILFSVAGLVVVTRNYMPPPPCGSTGRALRS